MARKKLKVYIICFAFKFAKALFVAAFLNSISIWLRCEGFEDRRKQNCILLSQTNNKQRLIAIF